MSRSAANSRHSRLWSCSRSAFAAARKPVTPRHRLRRDSRAARIPIVLSGHQGSDPGPRYEPGPLGPVRSYPAMCNSNHPGLVRCPTRIRQQQGGIAMVMVTQELAERIANVAELVLSDDDSPGPLRQLTDLSLELIPGSSGAGVVAAGDSSWSYAESDDGVGGLHQLQMQTGDGPVAETLRFGEARRIDDASAETRWPQVCEAMAASGLRSCLALPLRTDRKPGAALAIYSSKPDAFAGSDHDI